MSMSTPQILVAEEQHIIAHHLQPRNCWTTLTATLNAKLNVVPARTEALVAARINQGENRRGDGERDDAGLPRCEGRLFHKAEELIVGRCILITQALCQNQSINHQQRQVACVLTVWLLETNPSTTTATTSNLSDIAVEITINSRLSV